MQLLWLISVKGAILNNILVYHVDQEHMKAAYLIIICQDYPSQFKQNNK